MVAGYPDTRRPPAAELLVVKIDAGSAEPRRKSWSGVRNNRALGSGKPSRSDGNPAC